MLQAVILTFGSCRDYIRIHSFIPRYCNQNYVFRFGDYMIIAYAGPFWQGSEQHKTAAVHPC